MNAHALRTAFLTFFEEKAHTVMSSDSLLPADDPTVLFTGAGMNQFKDYFLGKKKDMTRAVSSQKCLRTGDLDNVGTTPHHHSFFEMLGNFSFGDYFKREAITWAWEFFIERLHLDPERLWVSVYHNDDEAYQIWHDEVALPPEHIVRLGDKDNFWPANAIADGPNGPCGPCSEIFFDRGAERGCGKTDCTPACGCDRFVEIWNLVFTQYNRLDGGALEPLPFKNIDTGMGLERMLAVCEGVYSNFETSLFVPINQAIIAWVKKAGGRKTSIDKQIHAIADHIRAVTFLIAEGVLPSNEERGYVARMLLRRSTRMGKQLGIHEPFLFSIVPAVVEVMEAAYPELRERMSGIQQIVRREEERFIETIQDGTNRLDTLIAQLKQYTKTQLPGCDAFMLYDTYGFPLELTIGIAEEQGITVDKAAFEVCMAEQRRQSRTKSALSGEVFAETLSQKLLDKHIAPTSFLGYTALSSAAAIKAVVVGDAVYDTFTGPGEAYVICDTTPFYAERGGQIGDRGSLQCGTDAFTIEDTQWVGEWVLHKIIVQDHSITCGECTLAVEGEYRRAIARNHTATHMLQQALRQVLGEHVEQTGSRVFSDSFSFDFMHPAKLTDEEINRIEEVINGRIMRDDPVCTRIVSKHEAMAEGALAFFGEKYGDAVRIVDVGDYSKELCGGTHVSATGEIGCFRIISESSIAAGTRRIEGVTGQAALDRARYDAALMHQSAALLRTTPEGLLSAIGNLLNKEKSLQQELKQFRRQAALSEKDSIIASAQRINDITVICHATGELSMPEMREFSDLFKQALIPQGQPFIIFLEAHQGATSLYTLACSEAVVKNGYPAGKLINEILAGFGGKGGGRANFSTAGGVEAACVDDVFAAAKKIFAQIEQK